jgi:hypothetical protein
MRLEDMRKIKVSIADYEGLQGQEKWHYIIYELQRNLRSALRRGADQFESVLSVFGLSGVMEDNVRKGLLELEAVRNLLLHRGVVIDSRFCQSCPWLGARIGAKLNIGWEEWRRYYGCVSDYVNVLGTRVQSYFESIPSSPNG